MPAPRRVALGAAAVAVLVGAGIVVSDPWSGGPPGEGGTGRAVAAQPSQTLPPIATSTTTEPAAAAGSPAQVAAPPVAPGATWIATLRTAMPYRSAPGGPVLGTLPATNPFGAANVVAVIGQPGADGWSRVELPIRPDGSTAWMQTGETTVTWTTYRVTVSIEARTLTVTNGATTVLKTPVAVGAPSTPTPDGSTYLWELIRPDDPAGAYGPYIFGLAMFSDAISVFNGGDAQIGIHGQDEPWSIGENVSHGCVRVANPVIAQLAGFLPLGTPVTIS